MEESQKRGERDPKLLYDEALRLSNTPASRTEHTRVDGVATGRFIDRSPRGGETPTALV